MDGLDWQPVPDRRSSSHRVKGTIIGRDDPMDPFWGVPPGTSYKALVRRKRRWWQFWKPPTWLEPMDAVTPGPAHPNCRCTVVPMEGDQK